MAYVFSRADVDALHRHARRLVLFGELVANGLEGQHAPDLEAFIELASDMIADAKAIEQVLHGGQDARTGVV